MIEAIPIIVETDLLDVIAAAEKKPVIVSGGREGHTRPIRDVHVAADLVEHYTYGIGGDVNISDGSGVPLTASAYNNRFLFSGRDYIKEIGLYDYRNRFYHPGLGRFLQTDPIGFKGDPSNLYRYVGNNPVSLVDPVGLEGWFPGRNNVVPSSSA